MQLTLCSQWRFCCCLPTLVVMTTFQIFWKMVDILYLICFRDESWWKQTGINFSISAALVCTSLTYYRRQWSEVLGPETSAVPTPFCKPWFTDSCKWRKELFYLTTHSTHFIYGYMIKDHSDNERGTTLPPHGLLFPISSKGSFICICCGMMHIKSNQHTW